MHLKSLVAKGEVLLLSNLLTVALQNRHDLLRKTYGSFALVG
jgi:hypothetical protein